MADQNTCGSIKYGNTGNCVEYLQRALNIIGNYGLTEDGVFGTNTLNAVKHYQASRGLIADGIVGNITWEKIDSDIETGVSTPITKPIIPSVITTAAGGVNWTTIGIVAAIAIAAIFMFTGKQEEY